MKLFQKALILSSALCGVIASAIPINITVDASGNLLNGSGIANNAQYAQGNNNPGSNLSFLNASIGNWNGVNNPDLSLATGPVAADFGSLSDINTYTSIAGYDYVVFHFGAGRAGGGQVSPGGWWQAFYLGGAGGDVFNLPSVNNQNVGGFSSARYFNSTTRQVPDGGMTALLLGLGLALTGIAARRYRKA